MTDEESSGNNEANDDEDEVVEMCPITHDVATDMFDKYSRWLEC